MKNKNDAVKSIVADATGEALEQHEGGSEEPRRRRTYTEEEKRAFMEDLNSCGRKGIKLPRLCVAVTPSNYQYVKTMATVAGLSYSEYLHALIQADKEKNAEKYEQAQAFRDKYWRRKIGK